MKWLFLAMVLAGPALAQDATTTANYQACLTELATNQMSQTCKTAVAAYLAALRAAQTTVPAPANSARQSIIQGMQQ